MNHNGLKQSGVCLQAIVVGVALVLVSCLGLCYNAMTGLAGFAGAFEAMAKKVDLPYFYLAFYSMSGICVLCYGLLLWCGVDLIRSCLRSARLAMLVLGFEVIYFLAIGALWRDPVIGLSVAAATGVANGGMMIQFLTWLPLWAPLLLLWAIASRKAGKADVPAEVQSLRPYSGEN